MVNLMGVGSSKALDRKHDPGANAKFPDRTRLSTAFLMLLADIPWHQEQAVLPLKAI